MKVSDRYFTYVAWSDEDGFFVGYCPDLFVGGVCHGANRVEVAAELETIIQSDIHSRLEKKETLPEPRSPRVLEIAK
jgi:predicted RNase H-like HicB family nuclease